MKLIDGKAIAERLAGELSKDVGGKKLMLGIISVGEDEVSKSFVGQKKKWGDVIGVAVREYRFPFSVSTTLLRKEIGKLVKETGCDGFIVQLPLPEGINSQYALNAIPETHDPDCLNQKSLGAFIAGRGKIEPPIVGAVKALLREINFDLEGKEILIIGAGRLVGRPIASWLIQEDVPFTMATYRTGDIREKIEKADLVIAGTGNPGMIKGDIIKEGAVVIDAGVSKADGKIMGDVDVVSCEGRNIILTPVPGGVGPLTVVQLFQNLIKLAA